MKYLLLIYVFWVTGCLGTHAQTIAALTEQLVALQELEHTVQQGYRLVTSGLQNIGHVTNGEFQLHSTYFGSLAEVNPTLNNDPKMLALRNLQTKLVQQIHAALDYWRKQSTIHPPNNER